MVSVRAQPPQQETLNVEHRTSKPAPDGTPAVSRFLEPRGTSRGREQVMTWGRAAGSCRLNRPILNRPIPNRTLHQQITTCRLRVGRLRVGRFREPAGGIGSCSTTATRNAERRTSKPASDGTPAVSRFLEPRGTSLDAAAVRRARSLSARATYRGVPGPDACHALAADWLRRSVLFLSFTPFPAPGRCPGPACQCLRCPPRTARCCARRRTRFAVLRAYTAS